MRSDSNALQHFFLRHLQQIHAISKARWGECAGRLALPFALTGACWTPVSSEGLVGSVIRLLDVPRRVEHPDQYPLYGRDSVIWRDLQPLRKDGLLDVLAA